MKWFHLQQHGWQQQTCKRTESHKRTNVVCSHLHREDKVDRREAENRPNETRFWEECWGEHAKGQC